MRLGETLIRAGLAAAIIGAGAGCGRSDTTDVAATRTPEIASASAAPRTLSTPNAPKPPESSFSEPTKAVETEAPYVTTARAFAQALLSHDPRFVNYLHPDLRNRFTAQAINTALNAFDGCDVDLGKPTVVEDRVQDRKRVYFQLKTCNWRWDSSNPYVTPQPINSLEIEEAYVTQGNYAPIAIRPSYH